MDFDHTAEEIRFRGEVRDVLAQPEVCALAARLAQAADGDQGERELYRLLGKSGILGASWPAKYGGRNLRFEHAALVTEELARAGIPDSLYVNGIQTVGQLILAAGTATQKSRILPGLARGELLGCILYSEPEAGSDLASLSCAAKRVAAGFELSGTKIFGLKCGLADIGLCAARTSHSAVPKYHGITMFLVDMHAPGVDVRAMDGVAQERFHVVTLNTVRLTPDDVVGEVDQGWPVLVEALPFERVGFDFAARAERWYEAALAGADSSLWPTESSRYAAQVEAARLLSARAAADISEGRSDPVSTSVAKWYASELAAELSGWALQCHAPDPPPEVGRAYREAPGLRLSGGTAEMMLQTLAQHLPDAVGELD
jgi:alkylation response protein AidB-like acyl-CoA dehydrogenase